VILDLRDDAGGSLDSAVEVCKLLLPANKLIVETRGRNDEVLQRYMTTENGPFRKIPLAVLVNQESASAAEIVAACLQDHHRAAVAGQRSYGKGTVQQLLPLESGRSLLKLTWASFWRPSNTRIHRDAGATEKDAWGVVPDAELEHRLTANEFEVFLRYRNHRDQLALPPASAANTNSENPAQPAFVDEQLQLAMKHLQSELGELSRPASNSR
jgi:carboxyl-terminal processing protease